MFGLKDHYDKQVARIGAQKVAQAIAASKRGDKLAMAKAGIRQTDAWSRAVLNFRAGVIIKRQARKDEEAQHVRRKGYR